MGGTEGVKPGRLRAWAWALRHGLKRAFVRHRVLILCKSFSVPPRPPEALGLVEHHELRPGALHLYRSFGRDMPEERLETRFRHGLRLFELRKGDRSVASTWAVPQGERFVDELGLGFPVRDGILWLRDIFVSPQARGQGLFASLLDAVVAEFPGTRTLWSAVMSSNHASVRAHERYGHEPVGQYEVLHLLQLVLWRRRWPTGPCGGSSFAFERRVLFTGAEYRRFLAERRA